MKEVKSTKTRITAIVLLLLLIVFAVMPIGIAQAGHVSDFWCIDNINEQFYGFEVFAFDCCIEIAFGRNEFGGLGSSIIFWDWGGVSVFSSYRQGMNVEPGYVVEYLQVAYIYCEWCCGYWQASSVFLYSLIEPVTQSRKIIFDELEIVISLDNVVSTNIGSSQPEPSPSPSPEPSPEPPPSVPIWCYDALREMFPDTLYLEYIGNYSYFVQPFENLSLFFNYDSTVTIWHSSQETGPSGRFYHMNIGEYVSIVDETVTITPIETSDVLGQNYRMLSINGVSTAIRPNNTLFRPQLTQPPPQLPPPGGGSNHMPDLEWGIGQGQDAIRIGWGCPLHAPIHNITSGMNSYVLGWLNYFFPIAELASILFVWLVAITAYYLASIVLRWIRAIS